MQCGNDNNGKDPCRSMQRKTRTSICVARKHLRQGSVTSPTVSLCEGSHCVDPGILNLNVTNKGEWGSAERHTDV